VQTLLPEENIRIGELSSAEAKGKHTTTHSQLYHFSSGGFCIDSPGIREFGLWHTTPEDVLEGFIDIREHAQLCKFRDCSHKTEPGCAVIAAVENGEIHRERFNNFQLILNQLDDVTIKTQDDLKRR
jgi:ribosome biogenesis GTPase